MPGPIAYLGRNDQDLTVSFAIRGQRYEYFLRDTIAVWAIDYMGPRWPGKALARAKRLAQRTEKVNA